MTEVQDLAAFVEKASLDDLSPEALEQLKIRVLDTLGVAVGFKLFQGAISYLRRI
jgi:2-methylcitrate dehydratase